MTTGQGRASIQDILLLFICLEPGAMVGIHARINHMPSRFLIHVGTAALVEMPGYAASHKPDGGTDCTTGSILLPAPADPVVRYGSSGFPAAGVGEEMPKS